MTTHYFGSSEDARYVIAIKERNINKAMLRHYYIDPICRLTQLKPENFIAVGLPYNKEGKFSTPIAKEAVMKILTGMAKLDLTHLLIADARYANIFLKTKNTKKLRNKWVACGVTAFEHIDVLITSDYTAINYNAEAEKTINLANRVFAGAFEKLNIDIRDNVVKHFAFEPEDVAAWLQKLLYMPKLACDIETFGLHIQTAGLASIAFAWLEDSVPTGLAIPIDLGDHSKAIREMLLDFFNTTKADLIYFNASYDVKILIREMYMTNISDWAGMHKGIRTLLPTTHDAALVAFAAQNSTKTLSVNLKDQCVEFLGDYGIDLGSKTVRDYPVEEILTYNIYDAVGTLLVWDRDYAILQKDELVDFYNTIYRPSLRFVVEASLVGLPIDLNRLEELEKSLKPTTAKLVHDIVTHPCTRQAVNEIARADHIAKMRKLKTKMPAFEDSVKPFNPGSSDQLKVLLYDIMKLPVLSKTATGNPSTKAKVIKRLLGTPGIPDSHRQLLEAIIGYNEMGNLKSTFIPAFKTHSIEHESGVSFLPGNLMLSIVQSYRMSCNSPNLMNLPSGSAYGKAVKHLFRAPKGYLLAFADFNALEARVNAILTQDPNKVSVYRDGFDSHCLNTLSYWKDEFSGIKTYKIGKAYKQESTDGVIKYLHESEIDTVPDDLIEVPLTELNVARVNSIKKHPRRDDSKPLTFSLQYFGTPYTLIESGLEPGDANRIYKNFHELYAASDEHDDREIRKVHKNGFIDLAFGAKLRAPNIQEYLNIDDLPYELEAEKRSVLNAKTQSYGLLLNRAIIDILGRIDKQEREDIIFINAIHDACYFLIEDNPESIQWLNNNLVNAMEWQELSSIKSDDVKMQADLEIARSWDDPVEIPNNADIPTIIELRNSLWQTQ